MSIKIISTVQFRPKLATCPAMVQDNFRRIDPLLCQAMENGSGFIVFPELFLTGFSFMNWEEAAKVAEPIDGSTFKAMRAFAIRAKAYVSYGYLEADGTGDLYNSCTMVDPNGIIITKYRKINLFAHDFFWATPGKEEAPIVETEFGQSSCIICRDLRDKVPTNIPRTASVSKMWDGKQLDIVAACTNWGKGAFPPAIWMDFVSNHKCVLAVADRWGTEIHCGIHGSLETDFGSGKSCIIDSKWKIHTSGLKFDSDCIITTVL
jgi:predicted amidohydrolase